MATLFDTLDLPREGPISILFVCMGNICRSPMAEAIFAHLAAEAGVRGRFRLDSAGLGDWQLGNPPDPRTQAVLAEHGITHEHAARVVRPGDFADFDLILCMDRDNVERIKDFCPIPLLHGKVHLVRHLDPAGPGQVADPVRQELDAFRRTYNVLERSCRAWLEALTQPKAAEGGPAEADEPVQRL